MPENNEIYGEKTGLEKQIRIFTWFLQTVGFPIMVTIFVALVYIGVVPSTLATIDHTLNEHRVRNDTSHMEFVGAIAEHARLLAIHNTRAVEALRIARETCIGVRVVARLSIQPCYEQD